MPARYTHYNTWESIASSCFIDKMAYTLVNPETETDKEKYIFTVLDQLREPKYEGEDGVTKDKYCYIASKVVF